MKHLKVAASVVNLAIGISFGAWCSAVSPPPSSPTDSTSPSAGVGQAMLAPHLPAAVADGKAPLIGTVGAQQPLSFAIQLPLRNQAELTRLLHDLYDPASPSFHKYLSVSEFTERFSATAADYDAVLTWAKANGLSVTATTPNRRLVAIEASADAVNRASHRNRQCLPASDPGRAHLVYTDRDPRGRADVQPLQITGLNNYVLPHPMLRHKAALSSTGSAPSGEYLPSDLRAAYYGNGPLTGAGQSIGIFSFDGYLASDVQLLLPRRPACRPPFRSTNVLVGGSMVVPAPA